MANVIQLKRKTTAGQAPSTSDVAIGELVLNVADGKVFYGANTGAGNSVAKANLHDTYALLASPDLTGNPTAPTQSSGNDSTRIATTAFVTAAVSAGGGSGDEWGDDVDSHIKPNASNSGSYDIGDADQQFRNAHFDGTVECDVLTIGGVTSVPFESADHSKLDGIASSANNYTHPSSSVTNIDTANAEVIDTLETNSTGHVTAMTKRTMTLANLGYTGHAAATNNTGTVTSVAAGAGFSFSTITGSGTIAVDGVLEDLDTLGAPSANGEFIVATGSGAFAYESASTARDSLGLGTAATRADSYFATGAEGDLATAAMPKAGGTFTGDVLINSTEQLRFYDTGMYMRASGDAALEIISDGSFQVDATGDITLDAFGGDIFLKKGNSTTFGTLTNNSGGLTISSGSAAISAYDSSGDFTGGRIIETKTMGISNLDQGQETWFSFTESSANTQNYDNHRMLCPYAGKIILATFICNDGISNATGAPSHPAVFSIRKSSTITVGGTWTTHTDNAAVWADTIPFIGPNPEFGRAGPVTDWAEFSFDAGDLIEAKVDVGDLCGASGARGILTMVIQWEA